MNHKELARKSAAYLDELCVRSGNRAVGSEGNRRATRFLSERLAGSGWNVQSTPFEAMDWEEKGADLSCGERTFIVFPSPYSKGCDASAELCAAASVSELERLDPEGKILLVHGELAAEQLMPKNFVFYNPDGHRRIVSLLEGGGAGALVCATGYCPFTAGGVYPFPLIEDGDFAVPSVYMTEEEGRKLASCVGREVSLRSRARRIPSRGENVVAVKNPPAASRIVVSAHIDAKKGSPGAIDNATGVVVLLLVAELLRGYGGEKRIELVAFNGEDYFAVPGQMAYLRENEGHFDSVALNINIDGAGYRDGGSYFSFFNVPGGIDARVRKVMGKHAALAEGPQWVQGDHSMFIQQGRPALAITSQWFLDHMGEQRITHTPADAPEIVSHDSLATVASALSELLHDLG